MASSTINGSTSRTPLLPSVTELDNVITDWDPEYNPTLLQRFTNFIFYGITEERIKQRHKVAIYIYELHRENARLRAIQTSASGGAPKGQ